MFQNHHTEIHTTNFIWMKRSFSVMCGVVTFFFHLNKNIWFVHGWQHDTKGKPSL